MPKLSLLACLLSLLCGAIPQAWAGAPVVDLSIEGAVSSDQVAEQSQESMQPAGQLHVEPVALGSEHAEKKASREFPELDEQDLGNVDPARLKQQIANYLRMNLPEKIDNLQQELAQLRGQLEIQAHDLKVLKDQQQQYDQDLAQHSIPEKLATVNKSVNLDPDKLEEAPNLGAHSKLKAETSAQASPVLNKVSNEQKEQQAYNKAFNLIKEKKYSQAIEGLKGFLKAYPAKDDGTSKYALNAYYWLGELYFLQGQFELAASQFKVVVKKFPGKAKVPDAMLKLGIISANLGNKAEAKQIFQDIKKRFPDSSAARTAALELQKL